MSLLFRMSPQQRALERRALAAVQDPGSASYHRWLTPEQYAAEFGASSGDIARATAWVISQGLIVEGPSRTATRLAFGGTIAQIEQAFRTEMHRYRVGGETHFAMGRAPSVPADLADLVLGVHGMVAGIVRELARDHMVMVAVHAPELLALADQIVELEGGRVGAHRC